MMTDMIMYSNCPPSIVFLTLYYFQLGAVLIPQRCLASGCLWRSMGQPTKDRLRSKSCLRYASLLSKDRFADIIKLLSQTVFFVNQSGQFYNDIFVLAIDLFFCVHGHPLPRCGITLLMNFLLCTSATCLTRSSMGSIWVVLGLGPKSSILLQGWGYNSISSSFFLYHMLQCLFFKRKWPESAGLGPNPLRGEALQVGTQ